MFSNCSDNPLISAVFFYVFILHWILKACPNSLAINTHYEHDGIDGKNWPENESFGSWFV